MNKRLMLGVLCTILAVRMYSQELMLPAFKSHKIKDMELLHTGDNFVSYNTKTHERKQIKPYDVSKELRSLKKKDLAKLLKHATLHMKKIGTDDYKVEFNVRAPGGGWWTAMALSHLTRAVLWAIPPYAFKKSFQTLLKSGSEESSPIIDETVGHFVDKGTNQLLEPFVSSIPPGPNLIGNEIASKIVDSHPNGAEEVVMATVAAGTSMSSPQAALGMYGTIVEYVAGLAFSLGMIIPLP